MDCFYLLFFYKITKKY